VEKEERKHGVMIKISDGMSMSFQEETLHHGTTIHQHSITGKPCPTENIYCIHFGLSMPTLCAFCQICIDQYIREMNIVPKMIVQDHVFQFKQNMLQSSWGKRKINQIEFQKNV